MWVFVDDDNGDNELIMQTIKNGSYGPFGTILQIIAGESGKIKK